MIFDVSYKEQFNPFTGTIDYVLKDLSVDELTSDNSSLYLSDDASDQTLTGDLGDLYIAPSGECFVQAQLTAEKLSASNTQQQTINLCSLTHNVAATGFDANTYGSVDVDFDYDFNDAAGAALFNANAINVAFDLTMTSGLFATAAAKVFKAVANYGSTIPANGPAIDITLTSHGAGTVWGGGSVAAMHVKANSDNMSTQLVALRTEARVKNTAGGIGYQGFCSGNGVSTGNLVGVYGLSVQGGAGSTMIGVDGGISSPGSSSVNQRMGIRSQGGHHMLGSGALLVANAAVPSGVSPAPVYVPITSLSGGAYIEEMLEVLGVSYLRGGAYVHADPGGLAGTLGLTNVFPALGGGATPTLGTIGGSGPTSAAQAGWKKSYNGTTPIFEPYWV